MLYFATLFDANYLHKGLALYSSMQQHIAEFKLFVLCLDDNTFEYFAQSTYTNIHTVALKDLEENNEELRIAKQNRGKVEYYFTLSPVLPLFILTTFPEVDFITTLDADIFFYSNPEPIFEEFKGNSILITPHRFPAILKEQEKYGLYNVSFQIFRNDALGLECLRLWQNKCIEWCYDRLEGDRFADQKYLDEWPAMFKGVTVLNHEGAGLAPWNIGNYMISKKKETVYSNNSPLLFYHFHDLKQLNSRWFTHGIDVYKNRMTKSLKDFIYHPYITKWIRLKEKIKTPIINQHLRVNSSPKMPPKEILKNHSTLYNIFSIYTIEINLKKYFRYFRKYLNP